jgi:hypothetical protein
MEKHFRLVIDAMVVKYQSEEILFLNIHSNWWWNSRCGILPLDNIKHLYGAVRLISGSLTDSNPALYLLEVFV